ncbi:hypothetical protein [uncultured Deefgea sp.]|uniref:hypothetical protein n=1 Tax=uncultured Deefgea sp. TaxID=1304914 RepID=UPI002591D12B|nr:hypothetical protein [uncultured Deefgea sp.]
MKLPDINLLHSVVLSKIDPALVDPDQAEYLISAIFGLRSNFDGLAQAIKCLDKVCSTQPWVRDYIPKNQCDPFVALEGLGRQLARDRSRFIVETQSEKNQNNPLHGKIPDHMVLACWTESILLPLSPQRACMHFLLACLFVWRCRFPIPIDAESNSGVSTELAKLCGKIRQLLSARDDSVTWPTLSDNPVETLTNLIQTLSQSKNSTLSAVIGGLQTLRKALSDAPLPNIPTPVRVPPTIARAPRVPRARIRKPRDPAGGVDGIAKLLPSPLIDLVYRPAEVGGESDEPEIEAFVELQADDDPNSTYVSRDGRFARLRSTRFRNALDNQFLPWAWGHLNAFEVESVVRSLHSADEEANVPALLCLLSICCGLNYQELGDVRVVEVLDLECELLQVCVLSGTWVRPFPALPGRFYPCESQAKLLAPFSDAQVLPLPLLVINLLQKICGEKAGVLGQIINVGTVDKIEEVMREYLSQIRAKDRRIRVRPARLRPILFDQLMIATGDELSSSVIINNDEQSPSVGLYYYSSPKKKVISTYQKNLSQLGLPAKAVDIPESRFGSRLFWEPSSHAQHIAFWRAEFNVALNELPSDYAELANIHNHFAAYTIWTLQCATGHRQAEVFSFNRATLNSEWAILSDKVVDDAHMARLVRLSPIAQQQLKNYQTHLRGLAQRINKFDSKLAAQIGTCAELAQPNIALPLFFILPNAVELPVETLGSKAIWRYLKLPDELPNNVSRHWFISGLREMDVPGEWAASAAGHVQIGQQAWSAAMLSAPTEIQSQWDLGVDAWLSKLAIEPMLGLPLINKTKIPTASILKSNFLPAKSNTEAQLTRAEIQLKLREWIIEVLAGQERQQLFTDLSLQEAVRAKIQTQYARHQAKQADAINYFVRYLRLAGRSIKNARALGFALACTVEPSPFQTDSLIWIGRGEWLRESILLSVPNDFVNQPVVRQYAWIMLTLAAYTGLVDRRQQELLYTKFPDAVMHYQQYFWLEWKDGARLVRYWPDFYSTIFISRLKVGTERPTWAVVQTEMERILLKELQFDLQCPELVFGAKKSTIHFAMKALIQWQQHYIPGFLCSYTSGEHKPWAIPRNNLVRLITGQRVVCEEVQEQETEVEPIRIHQGNKGALSTSKKALTELKRIIEQTKSASQKGQDDGKVPESRREVVRQIDALIADWQGQDIASLMFLMAEYAKFQLRRRTNGKYIAPATVLDYVHSAAEPLLELAWEENWVELDVEDLESFYVLALDHASAELRVRRAKRLRYFHDFCVSAVGQDELDLNSLDPAYHGAAQTTQPQIILQSEYEKALHLLRNDPQANQEQQQLQTLMLMIVFRFGLRVGEVLRLMTCDVVQVGENVVLYVHRNQLGGPKSSAGFRQAPCWNLTEQESELLFNRVASLEHRFSEQNAPLFCQSDDPNILVNRSQLTKKLLDVLKLVTGDESVRIHDARHTFASAAIAAAVDKPLMKIPRLNEWFGSDAKVLRKNWLGVTFVTRRLLYAISMHMGHSRYDTTIASYMHSTDLLLDEILHLLPMPAIKMATVAVWSGLTAGLVRQLKLRVESDESKWQQEVLDRVITEGDITAFQPLVLPALTDSAQEIQAPAFELPSIRKLEGILVNLQQGLPVSEIAQHYFMKPYVVEQIQLFVKAFSEEIQFDLNKHFSAAQYKSGRNKLAIFRELISKFEELKLDDPQVVEGIEICIAQYNPKIAGLLIELESDREKAIDFLRLMGAKWIHSLVNCRHYNRIEFSNSVVVTSRSSRFKSSIVVGNKRVIAPQLMAQFGGCEVDDSSRSLGMIQFYRMLFLIKIKLSIFNLNI